LVSTFEGEAPLKIRKRTLWTIGVAVVAAVLVTLLVLIAMGTLVLPGSTPAPVTVNAVQFTLLQGTNASGQGWFGPDTFVYTGAVNGYPFHVTPGATFSVPVEWQNFDGSPHTIYSISAAAPFTFVSTSPSLPATLAAYQDDAFMQIYVTAPSSAGATLTLDLTVNALPPT